MSMMNTLIMAVMSMALLLPDLLQAAETAMPIFSGQTGCYDNSGSSVDCAGTGQDGELRKGAAWPLNRFTDNSNGTLTDNMTGLVWTKESYTATTWQNALTQSHVLTSGNGNLTDGSSAGEWRLPNRKELLSIINYQKANAAGMIENHFNNPAAIYWSSDTVISSPSEKWSVSTSGTVLPAGSGTAYSYLAVRGPVYPRITVTPDMADFGAIPQNSTSIKQFTISNSGVSNLLIDSMVISGVNSADYTVDPGVTVNGGCGALNPVLAQAESCMVTVTFAPQSEGTKNAALNIISNDSATPYKAVLLSGANVPVKSVGTAVIEGSGDISCTASVSVGGTANCIITPAPYYQLTKLIDNNVDVFSAAVANSYTIGNITADHLVKAGFAPIAASSAGKPKVTRTGQSSCYNSSNSIVACDGSSGQDGDLRKGVVWPDNRFSDNGNGTLTDYLTGLVWTKESYTATTWQNALTQVNALANGNGTLTDGSSAGQWRLPNRKELLSIINYQLANSEWLRLQGFNNPAATFWSSDTVFSSPSSKWSVTTSGSALPAGSGTAYSYLAVRDAITPSIAVSPISADFGNVPTNTFSAARVFTIANTGTAALLVSSIVTVGGDATMFHINAGDGSGTTCGATARSLPPGGACTISVTFSPASIGAKAAALRVNSNDKGMPNRDIPLSGSDSASVRNVVAHVTGGNGTATCDTPVSMGGNSTCIFTPNTNFRLATLTDNSVNTLTAVAGNSYTISNVDQDHSIEAAFVSSIVIPPPLAQVPRTGQTSCYNNSNVLVACDGSSGQDGDLRKGAAWPDDRFTDNSNGTLTDNLTGLVWTKESYTATTWQNSLTQINALASGNGTLTDGSSAGQWRLPNRKELLSIINYQIGSAEWLRLQGFNNPAATYWSSDTALSAPASKWAVSVSGTALPAGSGTAYSYLAVRNPIAPVSTVEPLEHNFCAITVNTTSAAKVFTISNSGIDTLNVSGMTISGGDSGMFAINPGNGTGGTCGTLTPALASGTNCTVSVTFTPASGGSKTAFMNITSNDPSMPVRSISLSSIDSPACNAATAAVTFTLQPLDGYHLAAASGCNGTLNGDTYSFGPIASSCDVTATLGVGQFIVSASAGANGTITMSGSQFVNHNSTATFTVTPAAGYHIASVTGCGGTLTGNSYTTWPVTSNCSVSATFAANTFKVFSFAGSHGTMSPYNEQMITSNATTNFTVTPDTGYHIESVTGCGGSLNGTTYTTAPVTSSCAVFAIFGIDSPVITWPTPASISYGTALSATQLNATSNIAGTFAYTPTIGTVLSAGTQTLSVTFTPADTTNYTTISKAVTVNVTKVDPVITWSNPTDITYGTALSATQLNATSNNAGTFVYTPAIGTVLNVGTQTLSVTFTPIDSSNYTTVTKTTTVNVINYGPDLIVTSVAAPTTAGTSQQITIPITFKNQGTGSAGNWTFKVYLSNDSTITGSDTQLAHLNGSSLAAGNQVTLNVTVTVPVIPPGTYYFGAIVDATNTVTESDENNNSLAGSPTNITIGPDLIVISVVAPATASTSQQMTIPITFRNQGTGSAGNWTFKVYLSNDSTITGSDTQLTHLNGSSLAAGNQVTLNVTVTVPVVPPGIYYFGAIVDASNTVIESDETNNGLAGDSTSISTQ